MSEWFESLVGNVAQSKTVVFAQQASASISLIFQNILKNLNFPLNETNITLKTYSEDIKLIINNTLWSYKQTKTRLLKITIITLLPYN